MSTLSEDIEEALADADRAWRRVKLLERRQEIAQAALCGDFDKELPEHQPEPAAPRERADAHRMRSIDHALKWARIVERALGSSSPATAPAEDWWNLKLALDALDGGERIELSAQPEPATEEALWALVAALQFVQGGEPTEIGLRYIGQGYRAENDYDAAERVCKGLRLLGYDLIKLPGEPKTTRSKRR